LLGYRLRQGERDQRKEVIQKVNEAKENRKCSSMALRPQLNFKRFKRTFEMTFEWLFPTDEPTQRSAVSYAKLRKQMRN
jgi:hypothetical protein